jgi:hypothetical protein
MLVFERADRNFVFTNSAEYAMEPALSQEQASEELSSLPGRAPFTK